MRRRARAGAAFVSFIVLIAGGCGGGGGKSQSASSGGSLGLRLEKSEVQVGSSLISVSFFVHDGQGRPIDYLQAGDFSILENDEENSAFESSKRIANDPRAFTTYTLLLLDLSDSIRRSGALGDLIAAAQSLAGAILDSPGRGSHRLGVYWFDGEEAINNALPVEDFSDDADLVREALAHLPASADRSTNLHGAVVKGLDVLQGQVNATPDGVIRRGNIVTFTDGRDNAGRTSRQTAIEALNRQTDQPGETSGVKFKSYSIGLGGEIDRDFLGPKGVGRAGAYRPSSVDDLESAFADLAEQIQKEADSFYRLEYCSPKRAGEHDLTVLATAGEQSGFLTTRFNADGFTSNCSVESIEFGATAYGGSAGDEGAAIVASAGGDRYIAGNFSGSIDLDVAVLESEGAGFVIRLAVTDRGEEILWAARIGPPSGGSARIHDLALLEGEESSGSGRLFVAGEFRGEFPRPGGGATPSRGGADAFVACLDLDGGILWTRTFGGSADDACLAAALSSFRLRDAHGNPAGSPIESFVAAGRVGAAAQFPDGGTLGGSQGAAAFVARFHPEGAMQWKDAIDSPGADAILDAAVDSEGSIVVAGSLGSALATSGAAPPPPAVYPAAFYGAFSRSGARLFAVEVGAEAELFTGSSTATALAIAPDGTVFIAGSHQGTGACARAGDGAPANEPDSADGFVVALSAERESIWCRSLGGAGDDVVHDLALDLNSDPVVTGGFRLEADLGGVQFSSQGEDDIFVVALSGIDGHRITSQAFGAGLADRGTAAGIDPAGDILLTGAFSGSVPFFDVTLVSAGATDVFVLRVR